MMEGQSPYAVQWKPKLGRAGLFAISSKVDVGDEQVLLTLTADQAVALGGVLVSEGNAVKKVARLKPET